MSVFFRQVCMLSWNYSSLSCWNKKHVVLFMCIYIYLLNVCVYIYTIPIWHVVWLFACDYRAVGEIVMLFKLVGALTLLYTGFCCVFRRDWEGYVQSLSWAVSVSLRHRRMKVHITYWLSLDKILEHQKWTVTEQSVFLSS